MAKKRSNGNADVKPASEEIPEGFGISVGRERGEGWVAKEEGNTVHARLLGRYTYKDKASGKTRGYYQVKLIAPCKVQVVDPDSDDEEADRVVVLMEPGHIVNVDETAKLIDLEEYTKNGGVYDLWFVYGAKIDIGGREMWSMKGPRLKVLRKPSDTPDLRDDEISF